MTLLRKKKRLIIYNPLLMNYDFFCKRIILENGKNIKSADIGINAQ